MLDGSCETLVTPTLSGIRSQRFCTPSATVKLIPAKYQPEAPAAKTSTLLSLGVLSVGIRFACDCSTCTPGGSEAIEPDRTRPGLVGQLIRGVVKLPLNSVPASITTSSPHATPFSTV